MNNKGFISTAIIYTILVLFLSMLLMLYLIYANNRTLLTELKNDLINKFDNQSVHFNSTVTILYCEYNDTKTDCEYKRKFNIDNATIINNTLEFDYSCTNKDKGVTSKIEYTPDGKFKVYTNGDTECTIKY